MSDFQQKFIWWLDWHRFWHLATKRLLYAAKLGPKSLGTWVGWYGIGGTGDGLLAISNFGLGQRWNGIGSKGNALPNPPPKF